MQTIENIQYATAILQYVCASVVGSNYSCTICMYIYICKDRMCVGAGGLKLVNSKHLLAAAVNERLWQCKTHVRQ